MRNLDLFDRNELDQVADLVRRGAVFVVNHSGGKDSQAMALRLREVVPERQLLVIHAHLPEVDWPGIVEHIESTIDGLPFIQCRSVKTFFEMVERRGMFPSPQQRQCTSDLKARPEYGGLIVNCMGLRAEESPARAKATTFKFSARNSKAGREWYDWLPIHDWTTAEVFQRIADAGQAPHWAYAAGMTRLSCCFCIMASKAYYARGDDGQLRAVTGPDYGRVPDYEMVQAVMQIAGEGDGSMGWKVPGVMDWATMKYNPHVDVTKETTTLFASDRDFFIFLVDDLHPIEIGKLPNGDPDLVFRGFYVWGSELGARSGGVAAFYLRGICCNRLMWGVEGFQECRFIHSKGAPDRFMHELKPGLESFAHGRTEKLLEGVQAAKDARLAQDDDEMKEFLNSRSFGGQRFSKSRVAAIMDTVEREEGHKARTVWDVAQGITAVARTEANQDTRIGMEKAAGALLDKVKIAA